MNHSQSAALSKVSLRRADRSDPFSAVRQLIEASRWEELIPSGVGWLSSRTCAPPAQADPHRQHIALRAGRRLPRTSGADIADHDRRVRRRRYPAEAALENAGVYRLAKEFGPRRSEPLQGRADPVPRSAIERLWHGPYMTRGGSVRHPSGAQNPCHDRIHRHPKNQWGCISAATGCCCTSTCIG